MANRPLVGADADSREMLRRWLSTDVAGEDEAADAAFASLYECLRTAPSGVVTGAGAVATADEADASLEAFVDRTMARVGRARARDRRRALVARAAAVAVVAAGGALAALAAEPAGAWAVALGVRLVARAMPWVVAYATEAVAMWQLVTGVGEHVATALVTPSRVGVLVAVELLGTGALYGLRRLLETERGRVAEVSGGGSRVQA